MSALAIVAPLMPTAITGSLQAIANLRSPSPREAAIASGPGFVIDIDFGTVVEIDLLLLGFTNAAAGQMLDLRYGVASAEEQVVGGGMVVAPTRLSGRPRHFVKRFPAPIALRFVRISAPNTMAGFHVGVLAAGLAFTPSLPQEWGGGRFVIDTGVVTRLSGGGFGTSPGGRAGGWQWTLGDLTDAEVDALYGLQLGVGITQDVLVVEDPDQTAGLNERIHWGKLTRLEAYERRDVGSTRWAMRVEDWA